MKTRFAYFPSYYPRKAMKFQKMPTSYALKTGSVIQGMLVVLLSFPVHSDMDFPKIRVFLLETNKKGMIYMATEANLTPKQQEFVKQYLIDLNATQAAIRAGYSASTAQEQGSRMLSNVMVETSIKQAMEERSRKTGITSERVLLELSKIGFANLNDFVEVDEDGKIKIKPSSELDGAVILEISESVTQNGRTRKIKLHDKLRALELIGRHLAMFTDKQEIKIDTTEEDKAAAVNQLKEMLRLKAKEDA